MLKNIIAAILSVGLAAIALSPPAALAGSLTIQGSTTVANVVMIPHKQAIEAASGVTYEVITNGSLHGLLAVAEGNAGLGMISADLKLQIAKVSEKHPGKLDGKDLRAHQIGESKVAFITHPSNPVKSLNIDKIAAVLKGDIKNWSELGGPDAPIVVIAELKGGGIRSMVEDELLQKAEIKAQIREVPSAPQVGKIVAQLPAAFGLSTAGGRADAVSELSTDVSIAQPLILVTLGAPSEEAAKIIEAAKAAVKHAAGS
jgi:phosphate transport system substrate-binding protein